MRKFASNHKPNCSNNNYGTQPSSSGAGPSAGCSYSGSGGSASGSRQPASRSSAKSRYAKHAQPQINKHPLLTHVLQTPLTSKWSPMIDIQKTQYTTLPENNPEFQKIQTLFMKTAKSYFKVADIKRVENPLLMAKYLLRKDEMSHVLGKQVAEELLFHGTKEENVNTIIHDNFNWRLHGKSKGHRFGRGVSFSKISYYASHYGCKKRNSVKKMIVARVIIGECCIGNMNMTVPKRGYDTTIKRGGEEVIVKFQDDEFYPAYVITYTNPRPKKTWKQEEEYDSQDSNDSGGSGDSESSYDSEDCEESYDSEGSEDSYDSDDSDDD